jgi:GTP-binding protein LepA
MDIVQERLSRDYNVDVIATAPSVAYVVHLNNGETQQVKAAADLPDPSLLASIEEPIVDISIVAPKEYVGGILDLITSRRGSMRNMEYIGADRVNVHGEMPLAGVIVDFYDKLKSLSSGYASLNYNVKEYRQDDLAKLDIMVAGEQVEALSTIVHRSEALSMGRSLTEKLKELIPRQQYEISIQAAIGGKILARETIKAFRKDVTSGLYGGDVTRKMKLLKKQKEGKKRMKQIGKISIPQEAFLAVLKK